MWVPQCSAHICFSTFSTADICGVTKPATKSWSARSDFTLWCELDESCSIFEQSVHSFLSASLLGTVKWCRVSGLMSLTVLGYCPVGFIKQWPKAHPGMVCRSQDRPRKQRVDYAGVGGSVRIYRILLNLAYTHAFKLKSHHLKTEVMQ